MADMTEKPGQRRTGPDSSRCTSMGKTAEYKSCTRQTLRNGGVFMNKC
jgi:hypothetical protein